MDVSTGQKREGTEEKPILMSVEIGQIRSTVRPCDSGERIVVEADGTQRGDDAREVDGGETVVLGPKVGEDGRGGEVEFRQRVTGNHHGAQLRGARQVENPQGVAGGPEIAE